MDLDGDKIPDIVSGSYTGGLSFFKGLGNGNYAAEKKLMQKDGSAASSDYAQAPAIVDWNGDGHPDIVLGVIDGPVKLYLNNGDTTFRDAGSFHVNGTELRAGDGGPCAVDWDGDGIVDLILGDGDGNLRFFKCPKKGSLDLVTTQDTYILPKRDATTAFDARKGLASGPLPFTPFVPGIRLKPYAVDWNGDGKLDLVVGDYITLNPPVKHLAPTQTAELTRLREQEKGLLQDKSKNEQRLAAAAMKEAGLKNWDNPSKEQLAQYSQAYTKLSTTDAELKKATYNLADVTLRIRQFQSDTEDTGLVWVYLRR